MKGIQQNQSVLALNLILDERQCLMYWARLARPTLAGKLNIPIIRLEELVREKGGKMPKRRGTQDLTKSIVSNFLDPNLFTAHIAGG